MKVTLRSRKQAFTLIELLVVITIIAILAALLFPVLGGIQEYGRRVSCLSNLHQLTVAWLAYASDHKGTLICGSPGGSGGMKGWVDTGTDAECVEKGALFPYARDAKVYRCPSDDSTRAVNYSVSCKVDGTGSYGAYRNLGDIPKPAGLMVFCEEWDPRWPYGPMGCVGLAQYSTFWWDSPGVWHGTGTSFSFADGHAEYWVWEDADYLRNIQGQHYQSIRNQRDFDRVEAVYFGR